MKNTNKEQKSQRENQSDLLIDLKSTGKKRNWDRAKRMSLAVSSAYSQDIDLKKYGEKIRECGNSLKMMACPVEIAHGKKLVSANFCKCRQCIMCQGRRSSILRKEVIDLTHEHLKKYSTDVPLLLTLTVVNELGENMGKTIDQMTEGWKRLMQLKVVKKAARSWFRSLEVTYNPDRGDFHPHFHAVLMVPKAYFRRENDLYITHDEWLRLWKQSMRDDRITQVDIRRLQSKKTGELEALIGEVAKYSTKPSSYIFENEEGNYEVSPEIVRDLHYALKGRRLVAYGGLFSKIRKERKAIDIEKADLVDIDGENVLEKCSCKICGSALIEELYRWNFGAQYYQKIPVWDQRTDEDFQETEMVDASGFSKKEEEGQSHYHDFEEVRGKTSPHFEEASPLILGIDREIVLKEGNSFERTTRLGSVVLESCLEPSLILLRGPP
jgi:plasmid rolling circle replication initiator protein Rep